VKSAALAKITQFEWLSWLFPLSLWEKVELNSRDQTDRKRFLWESKKL